MEYTVLIQPQRRGFTAMIPTLPECHARGKTAQEAVNKVRERAQQLLAKSRLTTITLPENGHNKEDDPWLAMAGKWANDPTFDDFQKIVEKFRKRPQPANQTPEEDDPWLAMAGMWRDDPTWDEYQRLIKKYRKRPRGRK